MVPLIVSIRRAWMQLQKPKVLRAGGESSDLGYRDSFLEVVVLVLGLWDRGA